MLNLNTKGEKQVGTQPQKKQLNQQSQYCEKSRILEPILSRSITKNTLNQFQNKNFIRINPLKEDTSNPLKITSFI